MSPAFAASNAVAARAFGPSSATSAVKVSGPRELLITTSYPFATASRATWLPMCPAPMSPMVVMATTVAPRIGAASQVNREKPGELGYHSWQREIPACLRARLPAGDQEVQFLRPQARH